MFKTKIALNLKILKFLFFSTILLPIPIVTYFNHANAGLEFQWEQGTGFRKLKWFQKENQKGFRNTIYYFLRPSDRKADLLKIDLAIPKHFKVTLKQKNISLCKVRIGGFDARTKCLEDVPADVEIKDDKSSIVFYPYKPIPSNKDSYAIALKLFNPKKSGLYQFHSFGQPAGKSVSSYLGSWTIVID